MALLTKKPPYNLGVANSWRHLIYFQLAKPPNLEFPTFYHHLFDTVIPTPKIDPMWILLESIMTVWILFNGISMIGSMYPYNITILMGSDPAHGIRNMDPVPQFLWRQAHYTTPPLKTNMTLSGWNMTPPFKGNKKYICNLGVHFPFSSHSFVSRRDSTHSEWWPCMEKRRQGTVLGDGRSSTRCFHIEMPFMSLGGSKPTVVAGDFELHLPVVSRVLPSHLYGALTPVNAPSSAIYRGCSML